MSEWLSVQKNVDLTDFETLINRTEKKEIDIEDRSTKGTNSRQFNFLSNIDYFGDLFLNYIENCGQPIKYEKLKPTSIWMVKGDKGSYHRLHNHVARFKNDEPKLGFSCVLYLNVPDSEDTGEFYFLLKKENITEMNFFMPKKGDLIIMPNSVYHGVYPQTSMGERVTLNLDFTYAE